MEGKLLVVCGWQASFPRRQALVQLKGTQGAGLGKTPAPNPGELVPSRVGGSARQTHTLPNGWKFHIVTSSLLPGDVLLAY